MQSRFADRVATSQLQYRITLISRPVAERLLREQLEQLAWCIVPSCRAATMDATGSTAIGEKDRHADMHETRGNLPAAWMRQVAMYLCHVSLGVSQNNTGRIFCRDRTTVAHACRVVEDARDSATFDRTMEVLEAAARMTDRRMSDRRMRGASAGTRD